MSKHAGFLRLLFAACAIVVSLAMSFRPIPRVSDPNDTGRYVANQLQACALPVSGNSSVTHDSSVTLHSRWGSLTAAGDPSLTLPWRSFDWLMRPTCVSGGPRLFLFCVAMAVPVALLLFANWNREGTLLLAGGMVISTIGFEFMNNALRQGVSIAFLLGGFYFEKRLPKFAFIVVALLLHDSSWFFVPLAILLAYGTGSLSKKTILLWAIPVLAGVGYLFSLRFLSKVNLSEAFNNISESYAEQLHTSFLLFIVSPLLMAFVIRLLDRRAKPSREERIAFWYSAALLTLCMVIFPSITYRFAMTAITLQLFMAMRSSNISVRSGGLIAGGLVAHFMIYALISKSVISLFYG